jgi:hypothetical protein
MSSVKHYGVPERPINAMLKKRQFGIGSRLERRFGTVETLESLDGLAPTDVST